MGTLIIIKMRLDSLISIFMVYRGLYNMKNWLNWNQYDLNTSFQKKS